MADAWTNLRVGAGLKNAATFSKAATTFSGGLDFISQAGLGVSAIGGYGSLDPVAGGAAKPLLTGTVMVHYYLTPHQAIVPYVGYGLTYANYNSSSAVGTRAALGFLCKMQGGVGFDLGAQYDQLDSVGGANLTSMTYSGAVVINLSRPDERPEGAGGPGPRPGDRDHDGIPNRYDAHPNRPAGDFDRDGVPNRFDDRPMNPRRN